MLWPAFNIALKDLLDSWGAFLKTPESNYTLTDKDDGWFGKYGIKSLEADDRGVFNDTYVTPDPDAINRGYTSWDDFFTREVQSGARAVHAPENKTMIHNACESTVYNIATKM
ncbi:hypothetical protein H0H81_003077 [Sphagnurus paluster]|uniref:L-tryptophan decarboxylase PsiD-like domain-containing protein n=1 Tax=Sphagnurus paluster TaxID=117069 RepID=A0A9P7GHV4_9AGAR|nr:hypothetical protein H0H81_003077 [Sphagnurus paluster]